MLILIRQRQLLARTALLVALCFGFAASASAWHLHEGAAEPLCAACSVSADKCLEPDPVGSSLVRSAAGPRPTATPREPIFTPAPRAFHPRAPPRS